MNDKKCGGGERGGKGEREQRNSTGDSGTGVTDI